MPARKTPVLLRRGAFGSISVLTNYRRIERGGKDLLAAATNGKHDVTADFDAIVCELLLDDAPDALPLLDDLSSDRMTPLMTDEPARRAAQVLRGAEAHRRAPQRRPAREAMSQRQDSLTAQMETVRKLAVAAGCYDAEDWIRDRFPPADGDLPAEGLKTVTLGAWQLTEGNTLVTARVLRINSVSRTDEVVVLNVLDPAAGEEFSVDFKPSDDVRVVA